MGTIIVPHRQIISASGKDVESNGTTYRDSRVVSFALRRLLWRHQNIVVIVGDQNSSCFVLAHSFPSSPHTPA